MTPPRDGDLPWTSLSPSRWTPVRAGPTTPAAWRTERPVYVLRLPPCNNACPAGENIQQWLYDAEEGGLPAYEAAWRQIMADNPFPAVMGRVCYRPCETACNRAQLDSAVGGSRTRWSASWATRRSGAAGRFPGPPTLAKTRKPTG